MSDIRLPIGIDSFEKIRSGEWYYVDKTYMIRDLIDNLGEVNLFTRPRRFGKSLNMDMIKSFFEIGADPKLFDGLAVSKDHDFCEKYMGKYPVISVSLKDVESETFQGACDMLSAAVTEEACRHGYLMESDRLTAIDKELLYDMMRWNEDKSEKILCTWLRILSRLLYQHYGQKVVIIIDEYDVPLAKASTKEYYSEMVTIIRRMFAQGLKSNPCLEFGVLTGCLRVSKESIFTGLNNLNVFSISDDRFASCFGFTDEEVKDMLKLYGNENYLELTREWYDGYLFGNTNVYCPWDVINWCALLRQTKSRNPQNFWVNSSGNDALKYLIRETDRNLPKSDLDELMQGGTIRKRIVQELTYDELYKSIDNVWSLLYVTGYLTLAGEPEDDIYPLRIPNREVMSIFERQVMDLFMEHVKEDTKKLDAICNALMQGNAVETEKEFSEYLSDLISIRDTFVRKEQKENFYHGILLGILGLRKEWKVTSNQESGNGYADILIRTQKDGNIGIVIEMEYAEQGNFDMACERGMKQIDDTKYVETLQQEKVDKIYKFVIACYQKRCKVVAEYVRMEKNIAGGIQE